MSHPDPGNRATRLATVMLVAALTVGCGSRTDDAARYVAGATKHYEAGDLVRARLDLKNALQIQPKQARARYLLALVEEREQNYPAVLGNLLIAVESDPQFLDARIKLGNYYAVGLKAPETRAQADAALAIAPNDPSVRILNARAYYVEGNRAKAIDEGRYALRLDPQNRDAATLVASLHAEAGEREQALAVIDEVMARLEPAGRESLKRVLVSLLVGFGEVARAEAELRSMATDYPDDPAYDLALARLYAGQGRTTEAEERLRALVARDPDNAGWRVQLAGLLAGQKRPAEAERALLDALAQAPSAGNTLRFALAGLYESMERAADAERMYGEVAAAGPATEDGLAARNRIVALTVGRDDARARELVAGILKDAPQNVEALLYRAAYAFKDGKLDEAIADLRSVLARQPDSRRAQFMLARAYLQKGDAALAEDAYRKLLAADPTIAPARNELAAILAGRGNLDEATTLLREALAINPGDQASSRNLVTALLGQGDFAAAETEARRLVAAGEGSGAADYQLGLALQLQNEVEGALASFRSAIDKNPLADQPLADLTRLLVQSRRAGEAEAYLREHLKAHPEHGFARILLGTVYRDTGRPGPAREEFRAVVATTPAATGAWIGLASTYPDRSAERLAALREAHAAVTGDGQIGLALGAELEAAREFDAAQRVYEAVIAGGGGNEYVVTNLAILLLDQRPDAASHRRALELTRPFAEGDHHPFALAALGRAYYRNDRHGEAVQVLERATAALPAPNPQVLFYLGMAYLKVGNTAGARQQLQQAVDAARSGNITFSGLEEARATLATLG